MKTMMGVNTLKELEFIYKRYSVRRFTDEPVKDEDLKEIMSAAIQAPSGKHRQNWHFVIVKNPDRIKGLAEVVEKKNKFIGDQLEDKEWGEKFKKFSKYATLFKGAPIVVLIYAGEYEPTGVRELEALGGYEDEINALIKANPGVQGVSAAIENLMLAAAQLGYGTCWMTSPNYAAKEIDEYLGFKKEGYYLAAVTPIGVPDGEGSAPKRKELKEFITII